MGALLDIPEAIGLNSSFICQYCYNHNKLVNESELIMVKKIALFNHKGGVSKTTTTFNLGWMLAEKGKRVVMIDTDPQCNLTGMVLGYKGTEEFENFYEFETERNLRAGLAPSFESRPKPIEAVECIEVKGQNNLFLLPGHIRLAEYEVTLGISQELSGSIQTLKNLPGSISYLIEKTADKLKAEYVLFDMNPSLSSINQNILMISNFFIVPTNPDCFSVMAIDSLSTVIPRWYKWAEKAASIEILADADYPFPKCRLKFMGTIIQKYRPRSGSPTAGFQKWIDEINKSVTDKLSPALRENNMLLSDNMYQNQNITADYCLATIPDFNTLIAKSQEARTPIYALTEQQLDQVGVVLQKTKEMQQIFRSVFSDLADKIINLTLGYESSN